MKNQTGHTLLELIFVIVIIGISFPGLLVFFTNSAIDSVKNEIISEAMVLAQSRMEQIIADKHDINKGVPYIKNPNNFPQETIGQFTRTVSAKDHTIAGVEGVDVEVSIKHPLLQNNYTITHFFTNQDVY